MCGRREISHIGHHGGSESGLTDAEEQVHEHQLSGSAAGVQEERSDDGDDESPQDEHFSARAIGEQTHGEGQDARYEKERAVDNAHLQRIGPKTPCIERDNGNAHIGAEKGQKAHAAGDQEEHSVGKTAGRSLQGHDLFPSPGNISCMDPSIGDES